MCALSFILRHAGLHRQQFAAMISFFRSHFFLVDEHFDCFKQKTKIVTMRFFACLLFLIVVLQSKNGTTRECVDGGQRAQVEAGATRLQFYVIFARRSTTKIRRFARAL